MPAGQHCGSSWSQVLTQPEPLQVQVEAWRQAPVEKSHSVPEGQGQAPALPQLSVQLTPSQVQVACTQAPELSHTAPPGQGQVPTPPQLSTQLTPSQAQVT